MEDENEVSQELLVYVDQLRPFQGARSTKRPYRDRDELDDAERTLEAAGIQFTGLQYRGNQDPPDCEAIIEGVRCGIEVTELAHERALRASIKATRAKEGFVRYHEWTREEFLTELRERIAEKDSPTDLKDGPYERYLLVIWTGEMHLTQEVIRAYLDGITFPSSLITDAFISLDYHPGSDNPYPAIPLDIVGKALTE
ncbi:hypothetical protein [Microvirga aerophila]|uniref:hypothetical protein n=1 Tax=Microvirga aerophila TaxID=670291 RepID=UPI0011BEA17F|nr:hypothetical protein [Microvirga aerophila]